ncbi:MAG: acyltransferase [Paludibacteraceae bacterium]|nr:acyltransferase [Paludibacteraceae bacterium]
MKWTKYIYLLLYYGFAQYLPLSYRPVVGKPAKWIRYRLCKHIFAECGHNVNIERRANFSTGENIHIGNNSGIGFNCQVPCDIHIGNNVMMGPDCVILPANHAFADTSIPMIEQGFAPSRPTVIEDDVWIGHGVIMTPGRVVKTGSIIGAGCVLTKDFDAYSIIGGNPGKLIRLRK